MKRRWIAFAATAAAAALVVSCNVWGARDNAADPQGENYQGYTTVASSAEIRPANPADGGTLNDLLTMSQVSGAVAYELEISDSASTLDSSPVFHRTDLASNVSMNVLSPSMAVSKTYWWKARARLASGWDSSWSPIFSFTTSQTWPWTKRSVGYSLENVAMSADGSRLLASGLDQIYSADSGRSWNRIDYDSLPVTGYLGHVAMSSSGTVLAIGGGTWYDISFNSGSSWSSINPNDSVSPRSLVINSDGSKLFCFGNCISRSLDHGSSWTRLTSTYGWSAAASSADGTKIVCVQFSGYIWTSPDSGASWIQRTSTSRQWAGAASSSDGSILAAAESSGGIWRSVDSGANWSQTSAPSKTWSYLSSSVDGLRLVAVDSSGKPWASRDGGASWNILPGYFPSGGWSSLVADASGTKLAALNSLGGSYSDDVWTGYAPQ